MSSAAAATSAALAERASSVAAIAGMVCGLILYIILACYSQLFCYMKYFPLAPARKEERTFFLDGYYFLLLLDWLTICQILSHQNGDTRSMGDVKPRISEEANDKSKIWKLTEINEPSHCRSLKLPENVRVNKVCYLI